MKEARSRSSREEDRVVFELTATATNGRRKLERGSRRKSGETANRVSGRERAEGLLLHSGVGSSGEDGLFEGGVFDGGGGRVAEMRLLHSGLE
jgi:hypothetical protein